MKQRKRWLGLAAAPFALAFLAFAQPAYAADYTGDCANIPNHVTGNATVTDTNCVINTGSTLLVDGNITISAPDGVEVKSDIVAQGLVSISATTGQIKAKKITSSLNDVILNSIQNRVETKAITAGNSVQLDAGQLAGQGSTWDIKVTGPIVINTVQTNPNPAVHGNVLIRAAGPVNTETIRTDGDLGQSSIKSGGIQIDTYTKGANSTEFVIGGTASANGVNGNLITHSSIGGGTQAASIIGGINITNGGSAATGGIRVVDMGAIKVRATQSRSGWIQLNAGSGTLFLPTGKLNADGESGTSPQGAGSIYLLAKTIDVQPGTIISASQDATAAGTAHEIYLVAETIKYRGSTSGGESSGFKVIGDGNGGGGFYAIVSLNPFGYLSPQNSSSNVNDLDWSNGLTSPELAKDGVLNIDGTDGTAPLVLRADGNTAAVNVSGYPVKIFGGSDVTIRSRGQTLHRINLGFFGNISGGRTGLVTEINGEFRLDANGLNPGDAGGIIQVFTDQAQLTAPLNHTITADGDPAGGNGGIIDISTKKVVTTSKVKISADAAKNGSGNAVLSDLNSNGPQAIKFSSGSADILVGKVDGAFSFSALGGKAGGNGGGVVITPNSTASIELADSQEAIDVSALHEAGNAGAVKLGGKQTLFRVPASNFRDKTAIKANGGSATGLGGNVVISKAVGPQNDPTLQLRLNPSISVESGSSSAIVKDGSLTIDQVRCQQLRTQEPFWLKSYWRCVDSFSTGGIYESPALQANSQQDVRLQLGGINVKLYVFSGLDDYNAFFNSKFERILGNTATQFVGPNLVETGVFPPNATEQNYREVTEHELGHSLDNVIRLAPQSAGSDYKSYATRDYFNLDYKAQGPTLDSSTRRSACIPAILPGGMVQEAPFTGAISEKYGELICDNNGVLNPRFVDPVTQEPMSNSAILKINGASTTSIEELYAQAYAIEVYAKSLPENQRLSSTTDIVIGTNKFFACTALWARNRNTGSASTPTPGVDDPQDCLAPVPSGYVAF